MAKLGTVTQQPAERLSYTFDYGDFLTDGDNVQTAVLNSVDPVGLTVNTIGVFDPRVKFWVEGGTTGTSYKVTIDVTTADGRELQDELIVKVKEV